MELEDIHELRPLNREEVLLPFVKKTEKFASLNYNVILKLLACVVGGVLIFICANLIMIWLLWTPSFVPPKNEICLTPKCHTLASTINASLNLTADPCQDFYQYACGGWVNGTEIPVGYSRWDKTSKMRAEIIDTFHKILEDDTERGGVEEKSKIFYRSCMDKDGVLEQLDGEPLQNLLEKLGGWSISSSNFCLSCWNFQAQLTKVHHNYLSEGLFTTSIYKGSRRPLTNAIYINQPKSTQSNHITRLPLNPDLYNSLAKVVRHLDLEGELSPSTLDKMWDMLIFHSKLINISKEANNDYNISNVHWDMDLTELDLLCPVISWANYFNEALAKVNETFDPTTQIIVYNPEYMRALCELISLKLESNEGIDQLNNYMMWQVIRQMTPFLSHAFQLNSESRDDRWRTCVQSTMDNMAVGLALSYKRETNFTAKKDFELKVMFENIRWAFQSDLENADWMDDDVRQLTFQKAAQMTFEVGFPYGWERTVEIDKYYDDLVIDENQYFENVLRINRHNVQATWSELNLPVDKRQWETYPWTVNAFHYWEENKITVPAAYMQKSYFDPEFPKSVNYGQIGVTFGHELIHGFDDGGKNYDHEGTHGYWWGHETTSKFKERAQCFIDQYSKCEVMGSTLNGEKLLNENIADNGAIKATFDAYKKSQAEMGDFRLPHLHFGHDQLFFVSFAQSWCTVATADGLTQGAALDDHAPSYLRVQVVLKNLKEFSEAFQCPLGSFMNPVHKCALW